uniref:Uncharacterized protein n=1 Tax=Rangifer tarandus platyrhynchus TaxID=3082113 RepID=A0ACB0FJS0_RANTA|nr:unnamed protein product [Rangifer tarandus platyrhynchus]
MPHTPALSTRLPQRVSMEAPLLLCFSHCFFKDTLTQKPHNRHRIPEAPSKPLTLAVLGPSSFPDAVLGNHSISLLPPAEFPFLNPPRNVYPIQVAKLQPEVKANPPPALGHT